MSAKKEETRRNIIDAATRVFATEGIKGATTRQISTLASVNEVTLFRHFASKEALLESVIEHFARRLGESLAELEVGDQDLPLALRQFAESYSRVLEENEQLLRTFIAEGSSQSARTRRILHAAVQPFKDKLVSFFQSAQQRGKLRADLNMLPAVDSFIGMLLTGMLRRTALPLDYGTDIYLDHCTEIFLKGIQSP